MPVRIHPEVSLSVLNVLSATRVTDATPAVSTAVNLSTADPGSKFLFVMNAFQTNVANTGGTWKIEESATSGGSYTAATTSGSLAATPATTPGNTSRSVSVTPNPLKPWVKVTYTGADATAEVDVTAVLVTIPRAMA
jgi:hypothetical protein